MTKKEADVIESAFVLTRTQFEYCSIDEQQACLKDLMEKCDHLRNSVHGEYSPQLSQNRRIVRNLLDVQGNIENW